MRKLLNMFPLYGCLVASALVAVSLNWKHYNKDSEELE